MMDSPLSLFHIDDHFLFVQGIFSLLENEINLKLIGSSTTIKEGLKKIDEFKPDIILLDYFLPDGNGCNATEQILAKHPKSLILMLTMENNLEIVKKCQAAGTVAFLPKSINKDDLLTAIMRAIDGEKTFPELKSPQLFNDPDYKKLESLSKREKEIALLVIQGLSSIEISEKLFLSLLTVKTHRRNILQKLAFKNVAQLSAFFSKMGVK